MSCIVFQQWMEEMKKNDNPDLFVYKCHLL